MVLVGFWAPLEKSKCISQNAVYFLRRFCDRVFIFNASFSNGSVSLVGLVLLVGHILPSLIILSTFLNFILFHCEISRSEVMKLG